MRPVTYTDALRGRTCSNTVDLPLADIQAALDRGSLPVLVDPRRPRNSRPLCKIHDLLRHTGSLTPEARP